VDGEVVSVGDELLLGEAVDTNSAWLSARLSEVGVRVARHTSVGDNIDAIASALAEAARRAAVIVVTGGLGPTQDDVPRDAVARAAGVYLERPPAQVEHLRG
jgi:nicotinamide-nucleotide amidase